MDLSNPACELTSCKLTTNGPIKGTVFPGPALKAPKGDGKALGSWLKMQGISYSTSFQFGGSYICRECVRIQCHPRDKSCCLRNNGILQEAKRQTSTWGQRYALLPAQCSGLPPTLHTTWHSDNVSYGSGAKERRPCPLCSLQRSMNLADTCYIQDDLATCSNSSLIIFAVSPLSPPLDFLPCLDWARKKSNYMWYPLV